MRFLIVFGINISDIICLAIKWLFKFPAHLTSVAAIPGEREQMQHEIKKKKNISKFNHSRYVALNSPEQSIRQYLQCYAATSLWDFV